MLCNKGGSIIPTKPFIANTRVELSRVLALQTITGFISVRISFVQEFINSFLLFDKCITRCCHKYSWGLITLRIVCARSYGVIFKALFLREMYFWGAPLNLSKSKRLFFQAWMGSIIWLRNENFGNGKICWGLTEEYLWSSVAFVGACG